jgi:hypothetical protein
VAVCIRQIREEDAEGFREALDSVCRERVYLAATEAPALDKVAEFVICNARGDQPRTTLADGPAF